MSNKRPIFNNLPDSTSTTRGEPYPLTTRQIDVHFSSETDDWPTPRNLFAELDAEFQFTLDVCASADNAKCERYFDRSMNGLLQVWNGTCWMNPPYGRTIGLWIQKAYESSMKGATVVCLIPARTDTEWWHEYVVKADEVRFVRGRIRFGDAKSGAPFPSAIAVFRARTPKSTRFSRGVFLRRVPNPETRH
jgi:phage N-6-adenine-methyltransferase